MLNPVAKSIRFSDYLNFGALFDFFPLVHLLELVQFIIGYMLHNIEFAKFVYLDQKKIIGQTMALKGLTIGHLSR